MLLGEAFSLIPVTLTISLCITGISYECFQKILKGKVYKAMNGAIAGKYSNWPGVKEFAQKQVYGSPSQSVKLSDIYRLAKLKTLISIGLSPEN